MPETSNLQIRTFVRPCAPVSLTFHSVEDENVVHRRHNAEASQHWPHSFRGVPPHREGDRRGTARLLGDCGVVAAAKRNQDWHGLYKNGTPDWARLPLTIRQDEIPADSKEGRRGNPERLLGLGDMCQSIVLNEYGGCSSGQGPWVAIERPKDSLAAFCLPGTQ
jgi:hypothetical protein